MDRKIITTTRTKLSDMVTPVSIFMRLRDHYDCPCLLESNDYRSSENSNSIMGFAPLASVRATDKKIHLRYPDGSERTESVHDPMQLAHEFHAFLSEIKDKIEGDETPVNGFVGHTNFDAVGYFDTLEFPATKKDLDIPDLHYIFFRFLININHFNEELVLIENRLDGEESQIESVEQMIFAGKASPKTFKMEGEEESNLTDEEFRQMVSKGKYHCHRGDVFQIVLSRRFTQRYSGDDFNVYRVLRSVNPSPYLYYFDFDEYRIFGSSPESQLVIRKNKAEVNPIAGTYRRTGDDDEDAQNAQKLTEDPKENAEHIMLVDLARNDLGRHCRDVKVVELKDVQYFSHVIHLVSKVEGTLPEGVNFLEVFGDTFPAGTLSGAPKYRAIELINQYENTNRSFYGGGIGIIDFNGNITHAIIIRSFLSKDHMLYRQAGAGIVSESVEESELQEVNNKLGALKRALSLAENL